MFQSTSTLRTHNSCATAASADNAPRTPRFDYDIFDTLLHKNEEPQLGAQVISPRRGYSHHGIYVGSGRMVHYAGFAHGFFSGPIEEVSLCDFAQNRPIWIRRTPRPSFPPEEVIRRARMRVGENRYQLLRNNCEHFCEWCLRGEPRSLQVEYLSVAGRALTVIIQILAALMYPFARLQTRNASLFKGRTRESAASASCELFSVSEWKQFCRRDAGTDRKHPSKLGEADMNVG
jgi:hypothetical protein